MYRIEVLRGDIDFNMFLDFGNKHFSEVENKSEVVDFDLDVDTLNLLYETGQLVVATAFDEEELVGYYVSTVSKDLFSKEDIAKEVAIYVKKELRSTGICTELFKTVEDELILQGVSVNYTGFKKDHNEEFPIKLGYKVSEIIYEKVLK